MKKKIVALLLLLLTVVCCVVGLSACNSDDKENKPEPKLTAVVGKFELHDTPYQYGNLYILKWEYELYNDFTIKTYIAGTTLNGLTDTNTSYGNYTHYDTDNAIAVKWQGDNDIIYFTYENNILSNGVQKFYLADTNVEQPNNNDNQQPHTLTYDYNYSGAPNGTQQVTKGIYTNLVIPERYGYTFAGWYYNGNKIESGIWSFDEDITLTASWGVKEYSLTLNADGGIISETVPDTLHMNNIMPYVLPIPQKANTNFVGWYEGSDFLGEPITEITRETLKDYTLYAKYSNEQLCQFELSPDETYYSVIGYSGTPQYITIPATYNELPVTNIGANAFENCKTLISITIPNTVTKIGEGAFMWCSNLDNIYFTGTINDWCKISLSSNGFGVHNLYINNNLLTDLVIPNSITEIKAYAFNGFTCIKSVKISDSVTVIGNYAFQSSGITTLQLGNSVENIGENAFAECKNLSKVVLPKSIKEIKRSAFSEDLCKRYAGCYYLPIEKNDYGLLYKAAQDTEIAKPHAECTHINANAFSNYKLKSASISGNIKYIGTNAFYYYKGEIVYGGTFEEYCNLIGHENLFCDSGSSPQRKILFNDLVVIDGILNIPNTVNKIPSYTFNGYENIVSVYIPDSVEIIGEAAFYNCYNIEYLKIGDGVTEIGRYAFYNCNSFETIILGNSISKIGYNGFYFGKYPKLFYNGSAEDWENIDIDKISNLINTKVYYYSGIKPLNDLDNYWHYDTDKETPIIWE